MDTQTCLQILREIKDVAFATVDTQGNPQVRIIDIMVVEQHAIYFCTARGKAFYTQLNQHPQVAITGMNAQYQMVRLNGVVKKVENQADWMERIFTENPSMNTVYPGSARKILEAFCIDNGTIEFFDLGKQPIERFQGSLSQSKVAQAGFFITSDCSSCGVCKAVCPQHCIRAGVPYQIEQAHCLHCGYCVEQCPQQAIVAREEFPCGNYSLNEKASS